MGKNFMKEIKTKKYIQAQMWELPGDPGLPPGVNERDINLPEEASEYKMPIIPPGTRGDAYVDGAIDMNFEFTYSFDPNSKFGPLTISPVSINFYLKRGIGQPKKPGGQEKIFSLPASHEAVETLFEQFEDEIKEQIVEGIEAEPTDFGADIW